MNMGCGRKASSRVVAVVIGALMVLGAMSGDAEAIENKIVYIECTANGEKSHGSGVLVSAAGHVLTARHVVPDGSVCAGSIGVADPFDLKKLNIQPQNAVGFDAKLLKFAQNADYEFAEFCPYEQLEVRKKIFVAGFPGKTETGAPSYREGILSTTALNTIGVIETDGQSVGGMSGGPVFSENLQGIVGIVSGAHFAPSGEVSYYGILPVASFASTFNLTVATKACYTKFPLYDLVDANGAPKNVWKTGDGPLELGVDELEGFCHLVGIFGELNDTSDSVYVEVKDGMYYLNGENFNGGEHGAWATCVRFSY